MGGVAGVLMQYYDLTSQRYVMSGVEGGVALVFLFGASMVERGLERVGVDGPLVLEDEPDALEERVTPVEPGGGPQHV